MSSAPRPANVSLCSPSPSPLVLLYKPSTTASRSKTSSTANIAPTSASAPEYLATRDREPSEASTPEPRTPTSPTTTGAAVLALSPVSDTDYKYSTSTYGNDLRPKDPVLSKLPPQVRSLTALGNALAVSPAPAPHNASTSPTQVQSRTEASTPHPRQVVTENKYVPALYAADHVLPLKTVPVQTPSSYFNTAVVEQNAAAPQSQQLVLTQPEPVTPTEVVEPAPPSVGVEEIAQPTMSFHEQNPEDALVSRTQSLKLVNGEPLATDYAERAATPATNGLGLGGVNGSEDYHMGLAAPVGSDGHSTANVSERRPSMRDQPSRSYITPVPIVTEYEPALSEADRQRKGRPKSVAASELPTERPKSVASVRPADTGIAGRRSASRAGSVKSNRDTFAPQSPVNGSVRRLPRIDGGSEAGEGLAIGEIASTERQHELQNGNIGRGNSLRSRDRVALVDNGPVRPQSAFGSRPQPNVMDTVQERPESRAGGAVGVGRSLSRAQTLGRNGTLSRAYNGGTVGSRRGAFGRGAGLSVGTQPEEVLGRDDIHTRAELSERILDDDTLRRLSNMEKKDAKRLSKIIKAEAKAEAKSVAGSIKELERLARLQKEAAAAERKSQLRLSKYIAKEHKARIRFLKEKERYEAVEGQLRNAENDYEERRDHAAGLTAQVAEKTQDLDDLRAQKAADDREREVKLLALKNPAHS
ncbi:hypothetical protein Q5752_001621 [Cryptotrichosporon argae]